MPIDPTESDLKNSIPPWKLPNENRDNELLDTAGPPKKSKIPFILIKIPLILLIIALIVGLGLYIKKAISPKPSRIETLLIEGDENCVGKTNEALTLLEDKSPKNYSNVANYVNLIGCEKTTYSGKFPYKDYYGVSFNKESIESGPLWYAGVIAHETCHAKQFQDYEANKSNYSQEELEEEKAKNAEAECYEVQYNALKEMGADKRTLDYTKTLY